MKKRLSMILAIVLIASLLLVIAPVTKASVSGDYTYSTDSTSVNILGYNGSGGAITIPSKIEGCNVKTIRSLSESTRITQVTIPSTVQYIEPRAFNGCINLTQINVDSANPYFVSYSGVLYSKDELNLVRVPAAKSGAYSISKKTQTLLMNAFSDCRLLTSTTLSDNLHTIQDGAFARCKAITNITIPSNVTSIGLRAFEDCIKLTQIQVDANNADYLSLDGVLFNKAMTSLLQYPGGKVGGYTIPEGVTEIGHYAFAACNGLTNITMSKSLLSINTFAFTECNALTEVTIPDNVTKIKEQAFLNATRLTNVTIGSGVTSIGYYVFRGCKGLTQINVNLNNPNYKSTNGILLRKDGTELIQFPLARTGACTIPNGVIKVDVFSFEGCTGMTSISVPSTVGIFEKYLGSGHVFSTCKNLTQIIVDANNPNYKSIDGILYSRSGIHFIYPQSKAGTFVIPSGVTQIDDNAFANCTKLTAVTIPSNVIEINSFAFLNCTAITSLTIPSSVNTLWNSAFSGCTRLTTVTIQNGITQISDRLFDGCTSLASIKIPSSVTTIAESAFLGCKSLTSIVIPKSVTTVSAKAFSGCSNLKSVYFWGNAPLTYSDTFEGCATGLTLYYMSGNTGFTNPWKGYATATFSPTIVPIPAGVSVASAGFNAANIKWGLHALADGYEVYRSTSSAGTYTLVAKTTANTNNNAGLTTGKTYFYKVRAYRLDGTITRYSGFSNIVSAKPLPATPKATAVRVSATSIKVSWLAINGATKYEVYRAKSATGAYTQISSPSVLYYSNAGLTTGTTYYYKVRCYRLVGTVKVYGNYSAVVSART